MAAWAFKYAASALAYRVAASRNCGEVKCTPSVRIPSSTSAMEEAGDVIPPAAEEEEEEEEEEEAALTFFDPEAFFSPPLLVGTGDVAAARSALCCVAGTRMWMPKTGCHRTSLTFSDALGIEECASRKEVMEEEAEETSESAWSSSTRKALSVGV
jgi:hypothetical protein